METVSVTIKVLTSHRDSERLEVQALKAVARSILHHFRGK